MVDFYTVRTAATTASLLSQIDSRDGPPDFVAHEPTRGKRRAILQSIRLGRFCWLRIKTPTTSSLSDANVKTGRLSATGHVAECAVACLSEIYNAVWVSCVYEGKERGKPM